MGKALLVWRVVGIVLLAGVVSAAADDASLTGVSGHGWTVTADGRVETITVSNGSLGTVIEEAHLLVLDGGERKALHGWKVRRETSDQITIETHEPQTFWRIKLTDGLLVISSTVSDGLLTATAPISGGVPGEPVRQAVHLIDTNGVPVTWAGNDEVHNNYGGSDTERLSYLPRKNADVMTFALGPVAATNLHSLFDQATDIAIDFPEETRLDLDAQDGSRLDVAMPVHGSADLRLIRDYYTKVLGLPYYEPFDDAHFPRPPVVWSSWTSYYADVTEGDIVRNADWLAKNLKPYGFDFVQLDDGYDRDQSGQHAWIEHWDSKRFPHGPKWLAQSIKSTGLRAGIWLVPNAYAGAVKDHPDWYLRDKHGNLILDYDTPALDSSNPEVLTFLKELFTTLDGWGFDYYKFDGEHAVPLYVPKVDRTKLSDTSSEPLEVYRKRLAVIRAVLGPDRFVEGCPAGTPLNGIGYFQSYFNGDDLYNTWQGMYPLFSSINANAFLNHEVVYVMPGEGVELNPPMTLKEVKEKRHPSVLSSAESREEPLTQFGTTMAEAHTLVSYLALTGVVYPLASVMPELPAERVELLKRTLPPLPIFPVDLYSRGTDMQYDRFKFTTADTYIHNYPEILDLKVNAPAGVYDVVGVTNWRSGTLKKKVSFAQGLGLTDASYAVFDFWNEQYLGVFKEGVDVEVSAHDTRVLLIHPAVDHPQLMGTSRHISGSYSIEGQSWDGTGKRLRGSATTVAGAPYKLWVRVPRGWQAAGAKVRSGPGDAAVTMQLEGELLTVEFEGRGGVMNWEIQFQEGTRGMRTP
jgi:hypothetical protein